MVVKYDEQFFESIPEEIVRELRDLRNDSRFANTPEASHTMLWQYFIDRKNYQNTSFNDFKGIISYIGNVEQGFRIPPIKSAPKSDRIFVPGFGINNPVRVYSFLRQRGLSQGPLSEVGRLHSIWQTFFDSQGDNFLDDPTITIPQAIVHGETMKGYDNGNAHFPIADLMQRVGKKYEIPVYSLEGELVHQ